jgi:soluble lytic murein transglycosylase
MLKRLILVLGSFLIATFFVLGMSALYKNVMYPEKYTGEVAAAAEAYGVSDAFIFSVINVESRFRPDAVSSRGAAGLMQIMPATAVWIADRTGRDFKPADLFDPAVNIDMGVYYLRYLLDKFEERETAAAAYNAGETNVLMWLGDEEHSSDKKTLRSIPFPETRKYVEKIRRNLEIYEARD